LNSYLKYGLLFAYLFILNSNLLRPISVENELQYKNKENLYNLKLSGNTNPILINGSATGVGAHNWIWAKEQSWCYGSGTFEDPYIIKDLIIDGQGTGTCIDILNSNVYFIIQNCTCFNSGVGTEPFFHAGIRFYSVSNAKLINNNCSNNGFTGIRIYHNCDNNSIIGNIANNNPDMGIYLRDGCNDNNLINNTCNDNGQWGIELYIDCDNNTITRNMVKSNDKVGIQINSDCDNNLIFNNLLIANVQANARDDGIANLWDNNTLGNYWSDYGGIDADDDGIGDTPYSISGTAGNQDYYPIWDDGFEGTPIYIDGQASGIKAHNWTWASNKIWCSGSGTLENPYIIKNLTIDATGGEYGIQIKNSKVHFKIQNCTIFNSGNTIDVDSCVKLNNVSNGQISYNNLANNGSGIYSILLINSNNNNINHNIATNNTNIGIILISSNNNTIMYNNVSNNGQHGIYCKYSDFNNFSFNYLQYNTLDGFLIEWSCDNNIVFNNTINKNPGNGIRIKFRLGGVNSNQYNKFFNNIVANNYGTGIKLESSSSLNIIYNNYIIDNNFQASDSGSNNYWDNLSIGNYWSDYGGEDVDDDGIGDTPYYIAGTAGSQDYYPIWDDGDDLSPSIQIYTPKLDQLFDSNAPDFTVEITDPNLAFMWYTIDGGLTNITFTTNGTIDQSKWTALPDGLVNLTFYANDTLGHINSAQVVIYKDTIAPIISIIDPSTNDIFEFAPAYEISVSELNLDTVWYTLDNGEHNYTVSEFIGIINREYWESLHNGYITIRFYANDTFGHLNFDEVIIVKNTPSTSQPPRIPSYNLSLLLGTISLFTIITIKLKYYKKKF